MSTDLRDLYQEVILDHNRRPRNFHVLQNANRSAEGFNPLCGDKITLYIEVENGVIKDIGFQGAGCAISKASASMMTASLKGKTIEEAREIFEKFHAMVAGEPEHLFNPEEMGKLAVFCGVREFPVRVKCASLAWHTLKAALESAGGKVVTTTE